MQSQAFFDSTILSLKRWLYTLAPELKPVQAGHVNEFPHTIILSMVYHTTIIILAKPFLAQTREGNKNESLSEYHIPTGHSLSRKTVAVTLEAAKNICSLTEVFRERFETFRKSPITATHCCLLAALALVNIADQSEDPKTAFYTDKFNSCLRTLQELSTSWAPPRIYYQRLSCFARLRAAALGQASGHVTSEQPLVISGSSSDAVVHDGPSTRPEYRQPPWTDAGSSVASGLPLAAMEPLLLSDTLVDGGVSSAMWDMSSFDNMHLYWPEMTLDAHSQLYEQG